jgi:hypothetical protein
MAALTTQAVNLAGVGPTYAAAAGGGDTFQPSNNTFVHVKNGSGAPITVTIVTPGSVSGQAVADVTVSVPATTGERMIGPLPGSLFARASDGRADLTYSGVTSLTIAVLELDPNIA